MEYQANNLDLDRSGSFLVHSGQKDLPSCLFSGVACTDDSIIIGSAGFKEYLKEKKYEQPDNLEGRYSLFIKTGDGYIAKADGSGQDVIYYYNVGNTWSISNSFLRLARHLYQMGTKMTQYDVPVELSVVHQALFQQLLSNHTPIKEIKVLAADHHIKICSIDKNLGIIKCGKLNEAKPLSKDEYCNSLIQYSIKWASILRAIISNKKVVHGIDISGGVDSRSVLAIVLNSGVNMSSVFFRSNKTWEKDYIVASELAKEYDFSIRNAAGPKSNTNGSNAYSLWKYGNLGVYKPFYQPTCKSPRSFFHVFGGGGESLRDFYAKSAKEMFGFIENMKSLAKELREKAVLEIKKSFHEMDIDVDHPDAMMFHYRNFRSRFHFGRNWFRELSGHIMSPLTSPMLLQAPFYYDSALRKQGQVLCDIMMLNNARILDISFDSPEKKFSQEMIRRSPFYNAEIAIKKYVRDMKIYGELGEQSCEYEPGDDRVSMGELMIKDIHENLEYASEFSVFTEEYANQAIGKIRQGVRLTTDAMDASALITAGEIARLTQ